MRRVRWRVGSIQYVPNVCIFISLLFTILGITRLGLMLILPEWFVYRANLQQAYTHALHIIRQALSLPSAVGAST